MMRHWYVLLFLATMATTGIFGQIKEVEANIWYKVSSTVLNQPGRFAQAAALPSNVERLGSPEMLNRSEVQYEKAKLMLPGATAPQELTVKIQNGVVFLSDDIALMPESEYALKKLEKGGIINYAFARWPNGQIPYVVSESHASYSQIIQAINSINANTNICMVPRTNQSDYVEFVREDFNACWSYVGMIGGAQKINVDNCGVGSTIHEICHAAGMWHEQSRNDRDTYITVLFENITAGYAGNFEKYGADGLDVGAYDYSSIMHYPTWAFSKNGLPTIQVKSPPGSGSTSIGQRSALSSSDVATLNGMYTSKNCDVPSGGAPYISLYASVTVAPNPISTGESFTVTTNFVNLGTSTFTGCYYAALYSTNNQLLKVFPGLQELEGLGANTRYASNLTFNASAVDVSPGNYKIGMVYRVDCTGDYMLAGSETRSNLVSITVVDPNAPTLSVSPSSLSFTASGGTGSFEIASTNTTWSVSESAAWLSVNRGSGTGNGSVTVTCSENTVASSRSASITIIGDGVTPRVVTVSQSPAPATLVVSSTSLSIPGTGGSGTVSVTSNTNWTATESLSWASVTPGSSSGNGTATIVCQANPGTTARSGSVIFSANGAPTRTVTITQAGADLPVGVSPAVLNFGASGGNNQVLVAARVNWVVSSIPDWLTVSATNGSGNATVTVTCAENTVTATRTANLMFTGTEGESQIVTVTQSGALGRLEVSNTALYIEATGGAISFEIASNTNWRVSENLSWVTVSPTSGSNDGTVVVTVLSSVATSPRSGNLTITGTGVTTKRITITQAAVSPYTLTVTPASLAVDATGGQRSVAISSNTAWSVSESADWVSVTPESGNGNGSVGVQIAENTSVSERNATIEVRAAGLSTRTVQVNQSGVPATLSLSSNAASFSDAGGSMSISVLSNTSWQATETLSWLSVSPSSGSNAGTLTMVCTPNTNESPRSGTVVVSVLTGSGAATQVITVTQAEVSKTVNVNPSTLNFSADGGTSPFTVVASVHWTLTESADWLEVSTESGTGNTQVNVICAVNSSTAPRVASVTITGIDGTVRTVSVTQSGLVPRVSVTPATLAFNVEGGMLLSTIASNTNWTATTSAAWLTLSTATGVGNGALQISASANPGFGERSAVVSIQVAGVAPVTIMVSQAGTGIAPFVTPAAETVYALSDRSTVTLQIQSNTTWRVTENLSWISVSPSTGSNNDEVAITVQERTSTAPRTGYIFITGSGVVGSKRVAVTQYGIGSGNILTVTPGTLEFEETGGVLDVSVQSNTSWSVLPSAAWVTTSVSSGNTNESFRITCALNPLITPRSAEVQISAAGAATQTIKIIQAGAVPTLVATPDTLYYSAIGGSKPLVVHSNTGWMVIDSLDWLHTTPETGNGQDTVAVVCVPNPDTLPRVGTIVVLGAYGLTKKITVLQAAASTTLRVTPLVLNIEQAGGLDSVNIQTVLSWSAAEAADWLILSGVAGTGNKTLPLICTPNTSTTARSTSIVFTASDSSIVHVLVNQKGLLPSLNVTPTTLAFENSGGGSAFQVTSNVDWTINSPESWVHFSPSSGNGDASVLVTCDPYSGLSARSVDIAVTAAGGLTRIIRITQQGSVLTPTLIPSTSVLVFSASASSLSFSIASNTTWRVYEGLSWLSVTPQYGSNDGEVTVTVLPRTTNFSRTGIITIFGAGVVSQRIYITQLGVSAAPVMSDSPSSSGVAAEIAEALPLSPGALRVFPNPSQGFVSVEAMESLGGATQIRVIDLYGKVLAQRNRLTGWEAGITEQLDLSQHPEGMYIIQVVSDSGWWTSKVQIVR